MQTFISIVIALIIFGLLVLIHEFGHFIVAKKCGVVVNEFSIGMGPRIFSRVAKSGTRYSLKILPLGGSCAMLGEDEDNQEEGSFNSKSIWARMAIVFAGPLFNFVLAFILALIVIGLKGIDVPYVVGLTEDSIAYQAGLRNGDVITNYNGASVGVGRDIYLEEYVNPLDGEELSITFKRDGEKHTIKYMPTSTKAYRIGISYSADSNEALISSVVRESAFFNAGAQTGDVIIAINGTKISTGQQLNTYIEENPFTGEAVDVTLDRDGKEISINVTPEMTETFDDGLFYNLGREKQSFGGVIKYSFKEVEYNIKSVLKSLKMLITGQVSANEISGPVGIVDVIGDTYTEVKSEGALITLITMINMAIMLSANLGVMNLLPIPALDGGRLFLYIIEIIIRKPIPKDKEGMIHFIGFALLMALMVFLIFNDIRKIIF